MTTGKLTAKINKKNDITWYNKIDHYVQNIKKWRNSWITDWSPCI